MISGYSNKQLRSQKLKLNANILGRKAGQTISVKTHNGIPVDKNVRRYLRDAKTDNCCELSKPTVKKTKNTEKK